MADTPEVPVRVRTLATRLATPTPMRRGSLSERYVKCSKPGCACADRPQGPDAVALRLRGPGPGGPAADRRRPAVPAPRRRLLGGLRAVGRRRVGGPRGGPR